MNKTAFNKLKNLVKFNPLKFKSKISLLALAIMGFVLGKFFGLGAIIGAGMSYKRAMKNKVNLMERLVSTMLGCLSIGIFATVIGSIAMAVMSKTSPLNSLLIGATGSLIGFTLAKFIKNIVKNKLAKNKVTIASE